MESRLKKRLDLLDKELQLLHARVTNRCPSSLEKNVLDHFSGTEQQQQPKNHVQLNKYTITNKSSLNKQPSAIKGNVCIPDDCKKFLQNISKNIAKGSEAINKIASLTEISSLTGVTGHGDQLSSSFVSSSKNFVRNNHLKQRLAKSKCATFLTEVEKIIKQLHFPEKEYSMLSTTPTMDADVLSDDNKIVKQYDENIIVLNILKEKLALVKKKLRDERTKRENAEKAISGYRKRLEAVEGKTTGPKYSKQKVKQPDNNSTERGEENVVSDPPEKEKEAKQEGENDTDKKIQELQAALAENKIEIESLKESRQWALAMAETFRDRICPHDPHEFDRLKEENQNLQGQLIHWQEKAESKPGLIDSLLDRAERAERELVEKMKECNKLVARNSVNDPEVQELLDRHKLAYKELDQKKQRKEKEYRNQTALLKKELDIIQFNSEKRLSELNEKYNNALKELQGKEVDLQNVMKGKSIFENEIFSLKNRLKNASQLNEDQGSMIKELQEKLQLNNEKLEKLSIDYEEKKASLQSTMDTKLKELNDILASKEEIMQSLRKEVESCKDTINIKDKMLKDQVDTIKCLRTVSDNTKKTLDDERAQKQTLEKEVHKLQISKELLQNKLLSYEKQFNEEDSSFTSLKQKSCNNLLKIEAQVFKRQKALEKKLSELNYERDQAVQTARFVTEKMILAINDYETKLSVQRRIYNILTGAYKEKEFQLQIANQQLNELNEELWRSTKNAERMKNELQTNLVKACEVCTDVISSQFEY